MISHMKRKIWLAITAISISEIIAFFYFALK